MNDWVEFTAKTVDEAITEASIHLEVTSSMIEYEVIATEKAGFLGMFSRPAKIRARKKAEEPVKEEKPVKQERPVKPERAERPVRTEKPERTERPARPVREEAKPEDAEKVEAAAKTFLNNVFEAMQIEAVVEAVYSPLEGQVSVNIEGKDMGILIGKRGQTLDSLQYLTSLVVNKESNSYLKVKVDTENYRERRRQTLENLAKNISYKVKRTKRAVSLEPMNPYERRIIHSALQNDKYVETHSEGEEPYRRVVVTLKKGYRDYQSRSNHGRSSYSNNRGGYRKNFTSNTEAGKTEE